MILDIYNTIVNWWTFKIILQSICQAKSTIVLQYILKVFLTNCPMNSIGCNTIVIHWTFKQSC